MQDRARSDADSESLGPPSEGEQRPGAMQHYVAHQQMQQQNSLGMGQPYQQLLSPPGSEQQLFGPWVKYYIQRVSTNVNHVLFYVVDSAGNAKLAVVVSRQWGCATHVLRSQPASREAGQCTLQPVTVEPELLPEQKTGCAGL